MPPFGATFAGKRVLVTGHTGFKGAWLSFWLLQLGAKVTGYAQPPLESSLFRRLRLSGIMDSRFGDVRDLPKLRSVIEEARPSFVFHLAAQALVRDSYVDPLGTYSTNVIGTANVLEAVRRQRSTRVCQIVTSDKCYRDSATAGGCRENAALGGRDPYSASKACADIVTSSYRAAFFEEQAGEPRVSVSTVRAGNVFGGGDWAKDRLLPDCIRALSNGRPISLRNPKAVRPWQHVLEPLSGYLQLAALQYRQPGRFGGPWNFGPAKSADVSVEDIVRRVVAAWGRGRWRVVAGAAATPETSVLRLNSSRARQQLGWAPLLGVPSGIEETVSWYKAALDRRFDARAEAARAIERYTDRAARSGLSWAAEATT